ncbi:hypothetical protein HPB50_026998 [Hyalomma asiaticum]|uniref:Uncharacterized protein n=1 Tax=Hyalomma asiaticum TaxID=266040 RepID=A0ACB7SW35_HYAAI|nr:hypothetical protein HPB50_026998 [Hyalomma asiaticum]
MAASTSGVGDSAHTAMNEKRTQARVIWPVPTTVMLIRLWEDNLTALRSNSRNARIYESIASALNAQTGASEGSYTAKQVRQKMENLNKHYRKIRRCGTTTGSKGVEWPFYWHLHGFLGTLPINDESLVEENVEIPVVQEAPDESVVVASGPQESSEDMYSSIEEFMSSSSSAENQVPATTATAAVGSDGTSVVAESTSTPRSKTKSRKRPLSVMQELLQLHKKADERSAKAAEASLQLRKELVQLQKESNGIQQGMLEIMKELVKKKRK